MSETEARDAPAERRPRRRAEDADRPVRRPRPRPEQGEGAERPDHGGRRSEEARRPARRRDDGDSPDERGRDGGGPDGGGPDGGGPDGAPRRPARRRLGAGEAARRARDELDALIRPTVEGVVGVERDDDGWVITLDVLEDPHVPSSSDVLAEYEVRLDQDGGLLAYRRGRRYVRGRVEG